MRSLSKVYELQHLRTFFRIYDDNSKTVSWYCFNFLVQCSNFYTGCRTFVQRRVGRKHWFTVGGFADRTYANRVRSYFGDLFPQLAPNVQTILRSETKCFVYTFEASKTTEILKIRLALNFRPTTAFFVTNGMVFLHLNAVTITVSVFVSFWIQKMPRLICFLNSCTCPAFASLIEYQTHHTAFLYCLL